MRRQGRRAQGDLRGERRHDLRRAQAHPRQGDRRPGLASLSPYGISKKVVLDYLGFFQRYRGLDYTALALGNVYGPRQDPHGEAGVIAIFAAKMLAGETVTIFGDGNQTRDYVFIDDMVHAFVQAMDRGSGKLVNIGTGLEASVNHLYQLLADIIGFTSEPESRHRCRRGSCGGSRSTSRRAPSAIALEAVDPPRGRARRDRRVPQGRVSAVASPAMDDVPVSDPTFSLHVVDVPLEPGELDPASILAGSPEVTETVLWESPDGRIVRGIWRITQGTVTDTEQDELFVVIEGRATIEVADGPTIEVGPGDVCILERGARTTWTVHEPLRKVFQITLDAPERA